MNNVIKLLMLIITVSSLTHCATLPPPAQNKNISWETRVQTLSQIQQWNLQGVIGIRTAQDSISADITWEQHPQNYTITLFGPLGTHSFILTGQPHQVQLAMSDGRKFAAKNPETILAQQLNWHLPVSNLHYWIRGLPVPGVPAQKQFDSCHHLIELRQQGWKIQFARYTSEGGVDLPTKIFLINPLINVKIVIFQWQTQH